MKKKIDNLTFYKYSGYSGSMMTYAVGDRGLKNWPLTSRNIASSHLAW